MKDLQTNMMAGDQLNRMLEEGKKRLLLKRRQNNINEEGIVTISQNDMNALKEQYEEQLKQLHNDIDHFKEQNDALNDQLKRYEDENNQLVQTQQAIQNDDANRAGKQELK